MSDGGDCCKAFVETGTVQETAKRCRKSLTLPRSDQSSNAASRASRSASPVAALEIIAAHAVLGLGVADDRLDCGTALHLAADRSGQPADPGSGPGRALAGDPHPELPGVIVAATALGDMDAAGADPAQRFEIGDDRPQRVAVERIAVQCLGVQRELAAPGLRRGRLLGLVAGVAIETLQPVS